MEKKKSIGAFWKKVSKSLVEYYSGYIEIDGKKVNLVMFVNIAKKDEKYPDLQIHISETIKRGVPVIEEEVSVKDISF